MNSNLHHWVTARVQATFRWFDGLTHGALSVLSDAFQHFGAARAAEASASIAFFAIFSLFPILLVIIAAGSFVLESEQVQAGVLRIVGEVFPVAQNLIERNIQTVLRLRGTVGIVALIGLLWSSSGVLTALAHSINRAWTDAKPRNFVAARLIALRMVAALAVLFVLSLLSNTVLNVLARLSVPIWQRLPVDGAPLWTAFLRMAPRLLTFVALWGLYRWVPNTTVRWSEACWGALVVTVAGEVVTNGFTWYLSSGWGQYELVYGSLGTMVALMLWIYIQAQVVLFGAHLSAAVGRQKDSKNSTKAGR
jgi:membrane protein